MKICTVCGIEKDESEFYIRNNGKLRTECKKCNNKKCKEYRTNNINDRKEKDKQYYHNNKEPRKIKNKEWRNNNKEYIYNKNKEYRDKNRDKIRKLVNKRDKTRYWTDTEYNLKIRLRKRIQQAFKRLSKNGKTKSCKEYGIDFQTIFDKIGPKPEGKYHLDHIIPLSVFDLDNTEHVRLAHLPCNLRWLNSTENLSKGDSIDMQLIRCSLGLTLIAQEIGLISQSVGNRPS